MISNLKSSKIISKIVQGITVKNIIVSIAGVRQLTNEIECTVLQTKLISYTVANT